MTIVIAGKKLSLAEALKIASEPYKQSKKSKDAWNAYVKQYIGKKCKAGNCHTEDDTEDPIETLCIVCGKSIGDEYWSCACCKKDFCEDHMKNHEALNGREFDDD